MTNRCSGSRKRSLNGHCRAVHDYIVQTFAMSEPPTLYQWAGGRPAIARLIDCFYDRVERDDLLSPFFPGGVSAAHAGSM